MSDEPAKMGRPRKEIDWIEFDKLCHIQATQLEICDWFGISDETLNTRVKEKHGVTFLEYSRQKRSTGKISLRRRQWQTSEKNVVMQIWLGKQYLGQSDKQESKDVHEIKVMIDEQDKDL